MNRRRPIPDGIEREGGTQDRPIPSAQHVHSVSRRAEPSRGWRRGEGESEGGGDRAGRAKQEGEAKASIWGREKKGESARVGKVGRTEGTVS